MAESSDANSNHRFEIILSSNDWADDSSLDIE